MKKICMILMILAVSMTAGCGLRHQSSDGDTGAGIVQIINNNMNSNKDDSEDDNADDSVGGNSMELVTVDEFRAYYNLTWEDIEGYDVEGLIDDNCITSDDLPKAHWYDILKRDARLGVKYGCNLQTIIWQYKRKATEEDDFREARYIVYRVEIDHRDETWSFEGVVIDVSERKVYYLCNLSDYFDAEKVKDIDEETFDEIMNVIEEMELPQWENNICYPKEGNTYFWGLHIVMTKKDVIRCEGNIPGRDAREEKFNDLKTIIDEYCK